MDRPTVATYERHAAEWLAARPLGLGEADRCEAFARRTPAGHLRVDLGCGPGRHLPLLGEPAIGLDAAVAMLRLARQRVPQVPVVQADLAALPFRPRSLEGAWASASYQHMPAADLPMALAELHWALAVGSAVAITIHRHLPETNLPREGRRQADDFPDRYFSYWTEPHLADVLFGAGFTDIHVDATAGNFLHATATRARSLPDTVAAGMRLLICGLNPSEFAADAGVGYARPANRFWRAAVEAGLVATLFDARGALRDHGIGMTDLVKRATVRASELRRSEYEDGAGRVRRLVEWLQPAAVCFVGLEGYRAAIHRTATAGVQPQAFGGRPAYVMPSTSGLNARSRPVDHAEHLRAAVDLAASAARR